MVCRIGAVVRRRFKQKGQAIKKNGKRKFFSHIFFIKGDFLLRTPKVTYLPGIQQGK
jgi:hypothetical protein